MPYVKKPDRSHAGFRLLERGKTLHIPELATINQDLREGRLTHNEARRLVDKLAASLRKPPVQFFHHENLAVLEDYWRREGSIRPRRAPKAAYDRLRWAVAQLGKASLVASPRNELMAALDHLNVNRRRAAASALNTLLRFKGLNKIILAPPRERIEPQYLTLTEFTQLLPRLINPAHRLATQAAFATGCRYAELFALSPLRNGHVYVAGQRYKDWREGPTKNGKAGFTYVLPEFRDAVARWLALDVEVKKEMRRKAAPTRAWSRASGLNFHNLRHSYVRVMTERGASLDELAKWLRDSRATVEVYYRGWIQSDQEMQLSVSRYG